MAAMEFAVDGDPADGDLGFHLSLGPDERQDSERIFPLTTPSTLMPWAKESSPWNSAPSPRMLTISSAFSFLNFIAHPRPDVVSQ